MQVNMADKLKSSANVFLRLIKKKSEGYFGDQLFKIIL